MTYETGAKTLKELAEWILAQDPEVQARTIWIQGDERYDEGTILWSGVLDEYGSDGIEISTDETEEERRQARLRIQTEEAFLRLNRYIKQTEGLTEEQRRLLP
jgi:hypothetical protein